MKGSPNVIKLLNEVLAAELTAINQYFLHASMCKNWGFKALGEKIYRESIDEMRHAQSLIDRILFLEGHPNLQNQIPFKIGKTVPEQFEYDLKLEEKAVERLQRAIVNCRKENDITSAVLLEDILKGEEEHIDWLEEQIEIIDKVGLDNYLAQQL